MSSDMSLNVDSTQPIRFTKKEQEDSTEWVAKEVNFYESADDVADNYRVSLQQGKIDQQVKRPPAANKSPAQSAKLCKIVLLVLMLCVIIILAIYLPFEIDRLKKSNSHLQVKLLDLTANKTELEAKLLDLTANKTELEAKLLDLTANKTQLEAKLLYMTANNTQLEAKLLDMAANSSQLQNSYEILRENQTQLTDEVNRLKDKAAKWCPDGWTTFGSNCYCKYEEKKSWYKSRRHCQDRGADLVVIDSPDEQEFVKNMNKYGDSWIGLQYRRIGKTRTYEWRWVDGSAVTNAFWDANSTSYGSHATCCNDKGQWTRRVSYEYESPYDYRPHGWICEK